LQPFWPKARLLPNAAGQRRHQSGPRPMPIEQLERRFPAVSVGQSPPELLGQSLDSLATELARQTVPQRIQWRRRRLVNPDVQTPQIVRHLLRLVTKQRAERLVSDSAQQAGLQHPMPSIPWQVIERIPGHAGHYGLIAPDGVIA